MKNWRLNQVDVCKVKMKGRVGHIVVVLMLMVAGVNAQTAKLTASAPAQVGVGENFRITWELNANGSDFVAPEITDFQVLGGPNQSTAMQYVNGSMSQSLSFSYIVRGMKEGTFTIAPARIKANGQVIQSNAISIKVLKGSGAAASCATRATAAGPTTAEATARIRIIR
jgi:hypothetical protein